MSYVEHLSVSIGCPQCRAFEFIANPKNLPLWAAGLTGSELIEQAGVWIAQAPFGQVSIRFAENNPFGVIDHWVTQPDGSVVYVPLRVIQTGDTCNVVLTLVAQSSQTVEQIAADKQAVLADLASLKRILEL
ncbi:SRPBCC family protein [Neptunicella marina]|uniref:SRPBCC family protein n=1 Tax=Neptunicella marina TaxID=2125989 RepID=A0A8J6ITA7_9ALTE|nr:SRPBCC family protein [Neptunicella marina]MBC3767050.1 SRPBCC family protein [Neptunicella marina]